MTWLIRRLRALLVGPRLSKAADHHKEAADKLDAALREVLKK